MAEAPKPRRYLPRSSTGCNTCRRRKIKCGEERPHCVKCVKSGWDCDGYTGLLASTDALGSQALTGGAPILAVGPPPHREHKPDPSIGAASEVANNAIERTIPVGLKKRIRPRWSPSSSSSRRHGSYSIIELEHRSSSSSSTTSLLSPSPSAFELPFTTPGTDGERDLLHYFHVHAAPDLSGFSNHKFWSNLVLPSSHSEPAIRHATIALGALHRDCVGKGIAHQNRHHINLNAMQQYDKALRQLRKCIVDQELLDERTVLICCKIFYCIEVVMQDYPAALRHAKSGLNLLKEWKDRQMKDSTSNMNSGPADDLNQLVEVCWASDAQVRIFENGTGPYLGLTTLEERSGVISCIPAKLHSVRDALMMVNKVLNWAFHFVAARIEQERGVPANTEIGNLSEREELEKAIDQWPSVFDDFLRSCGSNMSSLDKISADMCAATYLGAKILVHFATGKKPCDFQDDFKTLINLTESIGTSDISKTVCRGFGFETGLVTVLWLLAMNCPDPAMRTRAICLIRGWPRRQGLWDGAKVFPVIEKMEKSPLMNESSTESLNLRLGVSLDRVGVAPGEPNIHGFSKVQDAFAWQHRTES